MVRAWLASLCLLIGVGIAVEAQSCDSLGVSQELLARYLFELRNNRLTDCEPGGDFLVDPAAINYSVTSLICQGSADNITRVNATYSFTNCNPDTATNMTLSANVRLCNESQSLLVHPMLLQTIKEETKPAGYSCPQGYTTYPPGPYNETDFLPDWEFAHMAENAFKYNLTVSQPNLKPPCNAYVSTALDTACVRVGYPTNDTSSYLGYATITSECVNGNSKVFTHVYVEGILPGLTPLEARWRCPWPEFVNGTPGFDGNFTFTQTGQVPLNGLAAAVDCMNSAGIDVITKAQPAQLVAASQVWNRLNDNNVALAVAKPSDASQVQSAVRCLSTHGVPGVPRSGGHSYEGYSVNSSGVTLDLGALNNISIAADQSKVTIGAGVRLGPLYYNVNTQAPRKSPVAGTCPPVGVGGLILGGGIGFLSRQYGLACDQIIGLKMVTAAGDIVAADESNNPELLWASCGGGGGNFGVVVEFTLRLVDVEQNITSFSFKVQDQAVDFMMHVQDTVSQTADSRLGLVFNIENGDIAVTGMFNGPLPDLNNVLDASGLGSSSGFTRNNFESSSMPWLDFVVSQASIDSVQTPQDLLNISAMEASRTYFKLKSFFVTPETKLDKASYQTMLDWVNQSQSAGGYIEVDLLGPKGAAASRGSNATAFPYRNAIMSVQYGIEWTHAAASDANIASVNSLATKLTKYNVSKDSPAYLNYIDISVDASTAYYGGHYGALQAIKSTYDPNNFFRNLQSIMPLGGIPAGTAVPPANGNNSTPGSNTGPAATKTPPAGSPAQPPTSSNGLKNVALSTVFVAALLASFACT